MWCMARERIERGLQVLASNCSVDRITSREFYCNLTRTNDPETEPQELVFNLGFTVNDAEQVALCYETRTSHTAAEAAELLLGQVLFPALNLKPFQSGRL